MSVEIKFASASVATINNAEYLMLGLDGYEQKQKARKFAAEMPEKPHVAEMKQYRESRSKAANSYAWLMMGKLASVLNLPTLEIYRNYIVDIGDNFDILSIREDAVAGFIRRWETVPSTKKGWVCSDLGESQIYGNRDIQAFYGSSTYDTQQMSNLIELIVQDCKIQGIETKRQDEIDEMLRYWDGKQRAVNQQL